MDNSPLNSAHYQHRRAESNLKLGRFDDAICCHSNAIASLQEAIKTTSSLKAKESLQLQCDYHKKQIEISQFKKSQFESQKKNFEKHKSKMAKNYNFDLEKINSGSDNLEAAIHKTMDEADSIIELLCRRNHVKNEMDSVDYDSIDKHVVQCHNISDNLIVSGVKEPKSDNVVIEELQVVNQQLRKFINQLLTQLEGSSHEIKTLRSKVSYLEKERNRLLGYQNNSPGIQSMSNNESLGANSSGFVFSPCSELSMNADSNNEIELPALPPLEMPEFNLESLISQVKINPNVEGTNS